MQNQLLTNFKLAFNAVALMLLLASCGIDSSPSDLSVIGGELVEQDNPMVDSVVLLQISMGHEASSSDFFESLLFGKPIPKKTSGRCTGTVVKNKHGKKKWHVVTAAHCLQGDVTSVKIYKGSQAFSKFPNPTSKKEAQELSEKIARVSEENGEQLTMKQLGFEMIAETTQFDNHADFNGLKIEARNNYAKVYSQLRQLSLTMSQVELYSKIETGVLADLKNDDKAFYDSLTNNFEIMLYETLIRASNSKAEAVEGFHAKTQAKLEKYETALKQLAPKVEKAGKELAELKDHPDDDIAILTINGDLPENIKALELAESSFTKGQEASLLGYGLSVVTLDRTEWASPIHPEQIQTTRDLKIIDLTVTDANSSTKEATFEDKKGGLCVGDSGGPALVKKNDTYVLAGVNTQADCNSYSKVSMVSNYTDWLHSKM